MKHYSIISIILGAILLMAAGCRKDPAKEAEKRIIEATSKLQLPAKLNDATTLTECYYRDKILTFKNEANADSLAMVNADSIKSVTLERLKGGLFPQALVRNVIDAKASIRYIYVCGADSIMFSFSPEELAAPAK